MSDFVLLETFLRTRSMPLEAPTDPEPVPEPLEEPNEGEDVEAAMAAVRRFHAALDDALDGAVAGIVREIAVDVVARELATSPADLAAIVERARRRYGLDEVLQVRAHPDETAALAQIRAKVVADDRLRRGDVEIDVRDGTIDATLGARLAQILPA